MIVVDDGSGDDSIEVLATLQKEFSHLRVVRHTSQRGQSAAMCTGADAARHAWLGFLDADGQNDPADLASLYDEMIAAGAGAPGMTMGHRHKRRDSWITNLSSRVANGVRGALLRDRTPDTGCSLKVLSRDDFLTLPRFDHMHRFLPALLLRQGLETISRPVAHYPRRAGHSNTDWGTGCGWASPTCWALVALPPPIQSRDIRGDTKRWVKCLNNGWPCRPAT